jgi:hypothetical protein
LETFVPSTIENKHSNGLRQLQIYLTDSSSLKNIVTIVTVDVKEDKKSMFLVIETDVYWSIFI